MTTPFVSSPRGPENVHRFAPTAGPIADLFERYLAVERLVHRPFQDDLRLGERFAAMPAPPRSDKPASAPDADDRDGDGLEVEANLQDALLLRGP